MEFSRSATCLLPEEFSAIKLIGFARTKLLQPVESQTLTFVLNSHNLASFDPKISGWVAESGNYKVKVGASSKDIKLDARFTLVKELLVKKESASLLH